MRFVFDLQAAQSASLKDRGEFGVRMVREVAARDGEVSIVLNGAMPSGVDYVRQELEGEIGRQNIHLWEPPAGSGPGKSGDLARRRVGARVREGVITQLGPDLLVETSLFAGWEEEIITGLGSMPEWFPVVAMAPGPDDAGVVAAEETQAAREWLAHGREALEAASYCLEIPGLTDADAYSPDLPDSRRVELTSGGARKASDAIISLCGQTSQERSKGGGGTGNTTGKPRLAFVSPLPPERTGIGYYSAELLPELAAYYDIDVVTDQDAISDAWIQGNCGVRAVSEFRRMGHRYDRVVYQFGNSGFHAPMWDLIKLIPGVAVVHDFYLGDAVACREDQCGKGLELPRELYAAHGFSGLRPLLSEEDRSEAIRCFPASFTPFRESRGAVVHSEYARSLVTAWYGDEAGEKTVMITHPRRVVERDSETRRLARERLRISRETFLVVTFGVVNKNKLPDRLLEAWFNSKLEGDKNARLVFVGEPSDSAAQSVQRRVEQLGYGDRVSITGWVGTESFQDYQLAADLAVQMRTNSRGETSGTVLDCMASGLPTICNAHGSFAELPDAAVWKISDEFSDAELAGALDELAGDGELRESLARSAEEEIAGNYHPEISAAQYREAIEAAYSKPSPQRIEVVRKAVRELPRQSLDTELAGNIARALPVQAPQGQLLVDVSVVAQEDLRTGVQRVVRSILGQLLEAEIPGMRVEPVYTSPQLDGFMYARDLTQRFLGGQNSVLPDEPIEVGPGDIFLGLDLHTDAIPVQEQSLRDMNRRGAKVVFVVHDLLPVTHPHWFPDPEEQAFHEWLETITSFDGAICVSQATANELREWMARNGRERARPFQISVVHNGADIENSAPTTGLPLDAHAVFARLEAAPSFLMVGTVEPRKGVEQALDVFEELWEAGHNVNLVVVGKQGWDVEKLAQRMTDHPEKGHCFFWLTGVSDEYLEHLYARSACLLAASEAEGFGLPLIEAAQHGIPILARDISVFREVAGAYAEYINADQPKELAQSLKSWLERYNEGRHAPSNGMPFLQWREVAESYVEVLLVNKQCKGVKMIDRVQTANNQK
ncbi:glycosyltransferase [Salinisphaera orenii]|uniref:glycosyltransferase n=1 Tax=Salinisphaera orenii TaxID=856731 RepID=UPI000DBE38C2